MTPRFHPFVRLVLCVVGALSLVVAVTLVVQLALDMAARLTGSRVDLLDFATRNPLLITLVFYPPILIWLWFCRRALDRQTFPSLGFRAPGAMRGLGLGALCGALAISFLFGLLWVTGNVRINGPSPDAFEIGPVATLSVLVFFAIAFFGVGFMEEATFRGYALHNLSAWLGIRVAIGVQAITFALVHLGNVAPHAPGGADGLAQRVAAHSLSQAFWDSRWAMLNIALIGWFFALCYLKTGSLWFPIGFHAAWNFFLGCVWSLPVSGLHVFHIIDVSVSPDALVTGGSFGAEGSVFLAAIIGTMIVMLHQTPDAAQARHDLALLCPAASSATLASDIATPVFATPATLAASSFAANGTSVANAPAVANSIEDAQAKEEGAPSRFKTSMRPSPRMGGAPAFDATDWPRMSTHAAPASVFSADAVPDVAADSSLRVDVSQTSALEADRRDGFESQDTVSRDAAASIESRDEARDVETFPAEREASVPVGVTSSIPIDTTVRDTTPRATSPVDASSARVQNTAPVVSQTVALQTVASNAAASEKSIDAPHFEPAGAVAPESQTETPKPEAETKTDAAERPAAKKPSPRW